VDVVEAKPELADGCLEEAAEEEEFGETIRMLMKSPERRLTPSRV
jgi:hypothetical protein